MLQHECSWNNCSSEIEDRQYPVIESHTNCTMMREKPDFELTTLRISLVSNKHVDCLRYRYLRHTLKFTGKIRAEIIKRIICNVLRTDIQSSIQYPLPFHIKYCVCSVSTMNDPNTFLSGFAVSVCTFIWRSDVVLDLKWALMHSTAR